MQLARSPTESISMLISSIVRRLSLLLLVIAPMTVSTFTAVESSGQHLDQRLGSASGVAAGQRAIHDDPFFFD